MANVLEVLRLTRRTALSALFFASGLTKLYAANEPSPAPIRQRSRDLLKRVVRWGCQYQKVDIDAIASSTLDMIVVDPSINDDLLLFIDREQCKVLQKKADGGRRIVLAYISVGEADTKRWYWPSKWRQQAPEWLGAQNPLWPGSYSVKYWDAGWRSLVFEGQELHSFPDSPKRVRWRRAGSRGRISRLEGHSRQCQRRHGRSGG